MIIVFYREGDRCLRARSRVVFKLRATMSEFHIHTLSISEICYLKTFSSCSQRVVSSLKTLSTSIFLQRIIGTQHSEALVVGLVDPAENEDIVMLLALERSFHRVPKNMVF